MKTAPPVHKSASASIPRSSAPPVYRPQQANKPAMQPKAGGITVQPKAAIQTGIESRPAPPVYRPQQVGMTSQPKVPRSVQPQSKYEMTAPVWIASGRQQVRVRLKGSSTPIGSVDVHYKKPGQAYISDLKVNQAHRRHGLGTMLMNAAMEAARRNGSMATELEAKPGPGSISNQGLLGMYTKLGYKNKGISQRGNPRLEKSSAASLQRKIAPVQPAVARKFSGGPVSKIIQLMEDDHKSENPYAKPRLSFKPVDRRTARQRAKDGDAPGVVAKPNYVPPKDSEGNKIWDGGRGSLSWNGTITAAMAPSKGGGCELRVSDNCTGTADGIDHQISFAEVQAGFERYEICDGRHHWAAVYKDDADAGYNNNNKTKGLCWSCTKCNSKKNGAKGLYENLPKWLGPCPGDCGYVVKGELSGE